MNEESIREYLESMFDAVDNEYPPAFDVGIDKVRSYEEAGVLTLDQGLVVWFTDGTKAQLTIKKVG